MAVCFIVLLLAYRFPMNGSPRILGSPVLRYTLSTESFWRLTLEARLKWGIPFLAQKEPHRSALAPWRYRPGCCVVTGPVPHTLVMRFTRLNCRPASWISQGETIRTHPLMVLPSDITAFFDTEFGLILLRKLRIYDKNSERGSI